MANLDGSRSHGARYELEVAFHLLNDPGRLASLCRVIDAGARVAGVEADLEELLDLEALHDGTSLLGQDELATIDLPQTLSAATGRLANDAGLDPGVTQQLVIAAARIGQHRFARRVLNNYGYRCGFCGLEIPKSHSVSTRLLVASHIKPWRDSTSSERLDYRNGVAACPTHDAAFEPWIARFWRRS
jgi:putative restriction endonuclease